MFSLPFASLCAVPAWAAAAAAAACVSWRSCHRIVSSYPSYPHTHTHPPHTHKRGERKNKCTGGKKKRNKMPGMRQATDRDCSNWLSSGWRLSSANKHISLALGANTKTQTHTHPIHTAFCGKTIECNLHFCGKVRQTQWAPHDDIVVAKGAGCSWRYSEGTTQVKGKGLGGNAANVAKKTVQKIVSVFYHLLKCFRLNSFCYSYPNHPGATRQII